MEVVLSNSAVAFLDRLDVKTRDEIVDILKSLQDNPVPYKLYEVRKLRGSKNFFRIRKGDIRVAYSIEPQQDTILILKIGRRESVYD